MADDLSEESLYLSRKYLKVETSVAGGLNEESLNSSESAQDS